MKITKGIKKPKAFRIVVYGVEGIGKTTIASKMPGALFLDLENGTHGIDVACIDSNVTFESLMGTISELIHDKQGYKTLVIDSLDILEKRITQQLCEEAKVDSIEKVAAYGKGYVFVKERIGRILDRLSTLVESGMNVFCIGHSFLRVQTLPDEQGSYDRYELKLSKQVAPIVKEWCDTLLFVNYKTTLVAQEGATKKKAQGGKRWVYAEHRPTFDAKHRASLPMPEDCSMDKAVEILSGALGSSQEAVQEKPEEIDPSIDDLADEAFDDVPEQESVGIPVHVVRVIALAKQYGLTQEQLEKYAAAPLAKSYGSGSIPIHEWPSAFTAWLSRGMEKIAKKILG